MTRNRYFFEPCLFIFLLFIGGNSFAQEPAVQAPGIQWQKALGGFSVSGDYGLGIDEATSIQQTADGGYIVAGWSRSNNGNVSGNHGGTDYWIVKIDANSNIQWQKALGGSKEDYAMSIQQTTDGGYIVAGRSSSNDGDVSGNHGTADDYGYWNDDYWIVKLDANGNILWQRCLGGSGYEEANSIRQTTDGGYIVAGVTGDSNDGNVSGTHGYTDYWVVKLDATGNIQWQKALGGTNYDEAYSIQQTTDGGYIVAGSSTSIYGYVGEYFWNDYNYWIVKLDATGNVQWQKSLGGTEDDKAYSVQQTTDGGYIIAGESFSMDGNVNGNHGNADYWVVKLDAGGNIQWQKALGGSGTDGAYSVRQTTDGGYIVAGYTDSNDGDVSGKHGDADYWVVKLDATGNIQWQKPFGGTGLEAAYSISVTNDGGYIVAGYTESNDGDVTGNHGSYDYWIVKLGPVCNAALTEVRRVETPAGILCPDANEVELQYTSDMEFTSWALLQSDLALLGINDGHFYANKGETITVKLPAPRKETDKFVFLAHINDDGEIKCPVRYDVTDLPTLGCDGTISSSLLSPASSPENQDGAFGFRITASICETGSPWAVLLVNTATQWPYAETSENKFITLRGLPAGTYKLSFGDLAGFCSYKDVSTVVVPVGSSGRVREAGSADAFSATLSPNPAQSVAELSLSGNMPAGIHLTDLSGRVLWKRDHITEKKVRIPLQNIRKGTYIVTVTSGKEKRTLKLIKTE